MIDSPAQLRFFVPGIDEKQADIEREVVEEKACAED